MPYLWNRIIMILVALAPSIVQAEDIVATLTVQNAWIREAPPNARALAGYMVIENKGSENRKLIGAESDVFHSIELHRTVFSEGIARMIPQDYMPVIAGGKLELKPGDYHLMMMMPTVPLKSGDKVKATLKFDNDKALSVTLKVKKGQGVEHSHHH